MPSPELKTGAHRLTLLRSSRMPIALRRVLGIAVFTAAALSHPETARADSEGPKFPTQVLSIDYYNNPSSPAWTSPENAVADDIASASVLLQSAAVAGPQYLTSSYNLFNIPSGATIDGIVVTLKHSDDFVVATLVTPTFQLVDSNGQHVGNTHGTNYSYTSGGAEITFGHPNDLWGFSGWTPDEINSNSFGVAFTVNNIDVDDTLYYVDSMSITVYYTPSGGGTTGGTGGGGSGGGGQESVTGGGGRFWLLKQPITAQSKVVQTAPLKIVGFTDVNANQTKQEGERFGFAGLPVTISGKTASGVNLERTTALTADGSVTLQVPYSDRDGYRITVATGSFVVAEYVPTAGMEKTVVVSETGASIQFGFQHDEIVTYNPCLVIAEQLPSEQDGSDAVILLQRLATGSGQRVARELPLDNGLVTRRTLFQLVARTQCLPEKSPHLRGALSLIDLRENPDSRDLQLMAALMERGLPVTRLTIAGAAADLESPISLEEAVLLLVAVLRSSSPSTIEGAVNLLSPSDPKLPTWAAARDRLKGAGVKLGSGDISTVPTQGLLFSEAAQGLLQLAFRTGKIDLMQSSDTRSPTAHHSSLAAISKRRIERPCLEQAVDRADELQFHKYRPGDTDDMLLRAVLPYGTKTSAGRTMWVMTGTKRPTEYGVRSGNSSVDLDTPVSMLETIRSLLIVQCVPPPTWSQVTSASGGLIREGTGQSRVFSDALTGVERDASLASRLLYRSQDRTKEFDLSLFTFAPNLLKRPLQPAGGSFTVDEGASLFASAFLGLLVREQMISRIEAENLTQELTVGLQRELKALTATATTSPTPLTRRHLLWFLAEAIDSTTTNANQGTTSLGEQWFFRLK